MSFEDNIPVRVSQISVAQISPQNMGFFVMLAGVDDERTLPIFIGATEAQSIAYHVNGIKVPRPLTHDLFKNVMAQFDATVVRVVVTELKNDTFFARLFFSKSGIETEVDSRPSDAIALALRFSAPIYVSKEVMESAGIVLPDPDEEGEKGKETTEPEVPLSPLESMKRELEKAVDDERYEDAARMRDEIKRLEDPGAAN